MTLSDAGAPIDGVGAACRENSSALLGGETADMPDLYRSGDFDLAGFVVGVAERDALIDGSRLAAGNVLLALPPGAPQPDGLLPVVGVLGPGQRPG